jgi:hypothetical protein
MDASERKVIEDVRDFGWHVIKVFEDREGPGFAFTIGLPTTFHHLECIIIGLPLNTMHVMLNALGESLRTGRRYQAGDGAHPTIMTAYGFGGIPSLPRFYPQMIAWMERGGISPSSTSGAGESTGRTGTARPCAPTARWASTTSSPPGSGWSPTATPHGSASASWEDRAEACWWEESWSSVQSCSARQSRLPESSICSASSSSGKVLAGRATWAPRTTQRSFQRSMRSRRYTTSVPGRGIHPRWWSPPITTCVWRPCNSYKFAAALQHAQGGPGPILLNVETQSGHGGGSTLDQKIDQQTDILAFLGESLRLSLTEGVEQRVLH